MVYNANWKVKIDEIRSKRNGTVKSGFGKFCFNLEENHVRSMRFIMKLKQKMP